jgi:ABC-2 type transport system permease protein
MSALRLLIQKGIRCLYNYRMVVRTQSSFKIIFSATFLVLTMIGLFGIFYFGFEFLNKVGGVGLLIINRLFALFFFGLGLLLMMSSLVTSYASFYQSPEVPFLLLKPMPLKDVISYKFLESVTMSSWAFFFIIIPFVIAYSVFQELSLLFLLWVLLFSVPFVLICCGIGSLSLMVLVRFLPRGRPLFISVTLFLFVMGFAVLRSFHGVIQESGADQMMFLNKLIPGFRITSHPLWPSYWVAEGMMSMSRMQWGRGIAFLALLVSWVGVLNILVRQFGAWFFYDGWQKVLSAESRVSRRPVMFSRFERFLGMFTPCDFKALLMKDLRVFLRDPAQWSQGLIFYGILGLYFINLRNLQYHTLSETWRTVIAFLNVFSVSAVMCSVGARFVYPQLSLEGHGFWIVGMSPVTMGRVLFSKFVSAWLVLAAVSFTLMYLSVEMLRVDAGIKFAALAIALAMACSVSGMSTGFGALFLDLKQRNPAAIISSFGGTLNLVMSLGFMFLIIVPLAAMYHFRIGQSVSWTLLTITYMYLFVVTLVATGLPLLLGRRSLLAREF